MQSEFHRLVRQVERLEGQHRAGIVSLGDVDELFALGRECRTALTASVVPTVPSPPGPVPVFKPSPVAAALAHEIGAAVESAIAAGFERVLSRDVA